MKCPICGKDVELKNRQIGTDENGKPVFNEYAICRDCKKQWNLDKQRAKKIAAKKAAAQTSGAAEQEKEEKIRPAKKTASEKEPGSNNGERKTAVRRKAPAGEEARRPSGSKQKKADSDKIVAYRKNTDGTDHPVRKGNNVKPRPAKKRPEGAKAPGEEEEEQRYGNIPSEKIRTKREKAVRQGYEDMLSTDPRHKAVRKKSPEEVSEEKENEKAVSGRKKAAEKAVRKVPEPEIDDYEDDYDDYEDTEPRFRAARILLGIVSLLGFGFYIYKGFVGGLEGISSGTDSTGTTFIILALCFLVAALLYFIMQKKNTVFAFLLPMIFYLGSAVAAFLMNDDEKMLLIAAVAGGVLAVISLILAVASRGGYDDDYEDPFDDEHEED